MSRELQTWGVGVLVTGALLYWGGLLFRSYAAAGLASLFLRRGKIQWAFRLRRWAQKAKGCH